MNRINLFHSTNNNCMTWGRTGIEMTKTGSALVFAAILIVCSIAVGCSSEQPKPISNNTQIPTSQVSTPAPPVMTADNKSAETKAPAKKPVHRKPATVNYTDKTSGVTFEYPRRYAIETGEAASELLQSSPVPMNFVAPGGEALAAVELPETIYASTDFSSAFFNVSVHKNLTADQCNEFAVPAPKMSETKVESKPSDVKPTDQNSSNDKAVVTGDQGGNAQDVKPNSVSSTDPVKSDSQAAISQSQPSTEATPTMEQKTTASAEATVTQPALQGSKLLLGDLELRATEAVTGEGTRQSDSKYFHVYQNGACYEFAMNVTTVASSDGLIKHVDRDKVFDRLEKILSTVKINQVQAEAAAEVPAPVPAPASPAQ
jgi:hypothetical protein